ncbi:MAG: NAD(P)/FAD-dependent oxidoreductase [Desulfobacterales bacterium]|nr:NAD(P)/FAD-dependent oxidoreductase [Desulfobacterales bacterium]
MKHPHSEEIQTMTPINIPSNKLSRRKFIKTMAMAASASAIDWSGFGALAARVRNKQEFPVVVIGSGLSGLVSAAYLAKYGFHVTLLEQHSIPGGYATSFERENFTFDVSLHATVAEHAMPQMILSDLGLWDQLEVAYTPEFRRIVTDTYDITLPAKNPDGVKRALSDTFPDEKKGIHAFYSEMEQVIDELWNGRQSTNSMMAQLSSLSLTQWMKRHVTHRDVKDCMSIFSGYYGLPPEKINALFYAIATGEYLVLGGQYFKARSQDLSGLLADGIEAFNGKIHYNTRADHIRFDGKNAVSGVTDHNGKLYPAKAVIANCPVPALIDHLLPKDRIPKGFALEAGKRQTSLSSFVVWLGLNRPLDRINDYEIDLAGTVSADHYELFSKQDLAESGISITIYDNLFKGYSAPGTTTMTIMALSDFSPWKPYEADYFDNRKAAYNKEKERIANRFVQRVEDRLIPGLSGMIEVMEIGTPLTNVYYTGNTGGAIYGYDRNLPHLKSRTPVKGLYLSSAWSHGGGYTPVMMAGRETAKALLKDFTAAKI